MRPIIIFVAICGIVGIIALLNWLKTKALIDIFAVSFIGLSVLSLGGIYIYLKRWSAYG